ncbi:MAG: indole-3-glycerol-phosphate synthase TrpC [Nitrososphaeria archaeon]
MIAELKLASPSGFRASVDPSEYLRAVSGAAAQRGHGAGGVRRELRPAAAGCRVHGPPDTHEGLRGLEEQLRSAVALGADAVLLITRILGEGELERLYGAAASMGLEVLVEVHDELDLERALALRPRMVGVNSRDLLTLRIDRGLQARLLGMIPQGIIRVAESGIRGPDDLRALREAGADAFLVGTALMMDPGLLRELLSA